MITTFRAIDSLSLIYIIIILIAVLTKWKDADRSSKVFALSLVFIILGITCEILTYTIPVIHYKWILLAAFFSTIFGEAIAPGFAYYCVYQANAKKDVISIWIARGILIANIIAMGIGMVAYFVGNFFCIAEDRLIPGKPQILIYIVELLSIVLMTVVLWTQIKQIKRLTFLALMIMEIIPIMGIIIEVMSGGIFVSYVAISIAVLLQYIMIQSRLLSEANIREKVINEVLRTDVMTGLKNRRAYTEYIDAMSDDVTAGVIFCDVNGLKKTNDIYGHFAGDKLIEEFALILKENTSGGEVFRISGDEFVVVYEGEEKKEQFVEDINRIRDGIKKKNYIASFGASFEEKMGILDIISDAEARMYEMKREYYLANSR